VTLHAESVIEETLTLLDHSASATNINCERNFVAAAAWPLPVPAQQAPDRVSHIAYLGASSPSILDPRQIEQFKVGLAENGLIEGQNIAVDYLWAEGSTETNAATRWLNSPDANSMSSSPPGRSQCAPCCQLERKRQSCLQSSTILFVDRVDEARALYLKYRGQQNVLSDKSWEAVILKDFAEFRKAGLTNPLMDEIEKQFAGS
jgi:hypothetical protein